MVTATLERRKMSKLMTMDKDLESIARDDEYGTNTTTASRIGVDKEEDTTTWCKEEKKLSIIFHDCFSELMTA